jgi:hypothetical protein
MPEIPRNRDCYVLAKGDTFTATVSAAMSTGGWRGGQGVQYTTSNKDELTVTYSDGLYCGFLLWGSDESSDRFTAMTRSQPFYNFATVGSGNWIITTTAFETYTYASRQAGPLVPIVYAPSDRLVFSLRGYWTTEDEWTLSADPRGPNTYYLGFVAQVPNALTSQYMTVQASI